MLVLLDFDVNRETSAVGEIGNGLFKKRKVPPSTRYPMQQETLTLRGSQLLGTDQML